PSTHTLSLHDALPIFPRKKYSVGLLTQQHFYSPQYRLSVIKGSRVYIGDLRYTHTVKGRGQVGQVQLLSTHFIVITSRNYPPRQRKDRQRSHENTRLGQELRSRNTVTGLLGQWLGEVLEPFRQTFFLFTS